jgi:hypothetical protein
VKSRLTVVAGLASAIALWIAPQASATITSSEITSPSDPTYSIFDSDNPNTIAVSGTTDSDDTGADLVDLECYYGPSATPTSFELASDVPLESDGSFSVPDADLSNINEQVCRLRAVPAGTTPADLSPFTGPVLGTGFRESELVGSGPNAGAVSDYYIWAQQLTAANDYNSAGNCGLDDGYLFNSDMESTTTTWYCNDWFWWYENYVGGPDESTRSQIQVDGADAYTPSTANDINPAGSPGFPELDYDYSVDPATGNLTITESQPIVKCPDAGFPPDSSTCPSFVGTGVRLDRTITQESDGHLVFFTDNWMSTDGGSHSIDLLPQNDQNFGDAGPDIQYKFPGEATFSTHDVGDSVSFPDTSPGAVYINVLDAPDGDEETGQGAIVFDRPASPAKFNGVPTNSGEFYFHQTGSASADCPATFRFAYAADYDSDDVQTLAQTALTRFATPVSCPGANPTPPAGPTGQRAAALSRCKKKFKKALKKKRSHDALTKPVKKHLKKKFKKCKGKARRLPV